VYVVYHYLHDDKSNNLEEKTNNYDVYYEFLRKSQSLLRIMFKACCFIPFGLV